LRPGSTAKPSFVGLSSDGFFFCRCKSTCTNVPSSQASSAQSAPGSIARGASRGGTATPFTAVEIPSARNQSPVQGRAPHSYTQTHMRTHMGDHDARGRTLEWAAHLRARTRTQCDDNSREYGVLAARGAHMTCVYLSPRLLQARCYFYRLCLLVHARKCAAHSSVRPRASLSPMCVRMCVCVCVSVVRDLVRETDFVLEGFRRRWRALQSRCATYLWLWSLAPFAPRPLVMRAHLCAFTCTVHVQYSILLYH
jgi:hypothetical protein